MVKKWEKNLLKLQKSTNIDFEMIIGDILAGEYKKYDYKKMQGYTDTYRVRIGNFRIVFSDVNGDIRILGIDSRGNIY